MVTLVRALYYPCTRYALHDELSDSEIYIYICIYNVHIPHYAYKLVYFSLLYTAPSKFIRVSSSFSFELLDSLAQFSSVIVNLQKAVAQYDGRVYAVRYDGCKNVVCL